MQVSVKLFGAFRKYGNGSEIQVELTEPAKVSDLRSALVQRLNDLHPGFRDNALMGESAFADESKVLSDEASVRAGATFAVLPPVCGG